MMSGVLASPLSHSSFQSISQRHSCRIVAPLSSCSIPTPFFTYACNLRLNCASKLSESSPLAAVSRRLGLRCSCSSFPGGPGSGETDNKTDSKTILDAFFLGRALGEVVTERIESVVGEILSAVGRLQAEQQKQVEEFQEEVFERAKRAKETARHEVLEEKAPLRNASAPIVPVVVNGASSSVATSQDDPTSPSPIASSSVADSNASGVNEEKTDDDPISEISIDD